MQCTILYMVNSHMALDRMLARDWLIKNFGSRDTKALSIEKRSIVFAVLLTHVIWIRVLKES